MLILQIDGITGATAPYDLYVCDVYGNQCAVLATINTPIPPTITLNVPYQFINAPAIGLKIIDVNCCEQFDIIYFDAFAPDKQPEMWNKEVFAKMHAALKPGGILVTYCAKGQVKRDLKEAGFVVEVVAGPPGKREMTRARK